MEFLKKNHKLIIGIIIGSILLSGISVYATSRYLASQVSYKDGKSVEDALNDLYSKGIISIDESNVKYAESSGNNTTSRTTSLNLDKGKYIVVTNSTIGYKSSSAVTSSSYDNSTPGISVTSNNNTVSALKGFGNTRCATSKSSDVYTIIILNSRAYYVEINDDSDTVTYSYSSQSQPTVPNTIYMYSIKIK